MAGPGAPLSQIKLAFSKLRALKPAFDFALVLPAKWVLCRHGQQFVSICHVAAYNSGRNERLVEIE